VLRVIGGGGGERVGCEIGGVGTGGGGEVGDIELLILGIIPGN
jgi:hypothetical protein